MPREKQGYRDMLQFLSDKGIPNTVSHTEAMKILNVSQHTLEKHIKSGKIKSYCHKIPIGSIASYLCG